jgi:YD repeat-containing protein
VNWILGLPSHTELKERRGNLVSQSWLYYDNHTDYTDIPEKGNLTKEEVWLSAEDKTNPVTEKNYDDYGNVISTTDARGNVSTVTYDSATHTWPETVTNTLGHTIKNTYDPATGQILTATDPNNQTSRNTYDTFNRPEAVFGPNDDETHPSTWYEYDVATTPAKITVCLREEDNTDAPNKIRTTYSFVDGLGRTIQSKTEADDPTKQVVIGTVTFDSRGKGKERYHPYFTEKNEEYTIPDLLQPKASYEYDCLGRVIKQINPDSTEQTIEYALGVVTTTDENGHKIRKHQDIYGRTVKIEEFNLGKTYTTLYAYDIQGNLLKTTDNQGNITTIAYDSLGRKTAMDDPDMGEWSYDYDSGGNLIKQTDAKEQVIEFEYDELNRLTKKWGLSPQGTVPIFSVNYLYDDLSKPNTIGRLSRVEDSNCITEFFYDNLGRETKSVKTVDGTAYTVERSYDAIDRLKTLTYPDGETVTYTYTTSGGIKTVTGKETYVSDIIYTAAGQMSMLSYGNDTHTDYEYHPETLRLKHLTTNDGVLQDLEYLFDNVGNISIIADNCNSATQTFGYDDLNRLTQARGQTYGTINYRYDSIGNILEKDGVAYTYGRSNLNYLRPQWQYAN